MQMSESQAKMFKKVVDNGMYRTSDLREKKTAIALEKLGFVDVVIHSEGIINKFYWMEVRKAY